VEENKYNNKPTKKPRARKKRGTQRGDNSIRIKDEKYAETKALKS